MISHRSGRLQASLGMLTLAATLGAGSSFTAIGRLQPMPCLTPSDLVSFQPAIREQVQKAYEVVQANPTDAEAKGRLGMILQAYEQYQLALECYQRALSPEPVSIRSAPPASPKSTSPGSWKWAYYLGVLQASLGKKTEAVVTLRQAVQLKADYLPARLKLAESLLDSGQWEESRKIYEAVVKQYPDCALAYYGLGRIKSARGDLAAAAESLRKACQLSPAFGAAHYALGMTYRDLGEMAKSREQLALFERHKERRPPVEDPLLDAINALKSGANHHLDKGFRLKKDGSLQQAVAEFEQALEADPHSAQAHAALLSTYLELGQWSKAEEHYQAVVKLDPHRYEAHHIFGVALTQQGKYREAADAFRKALEINPFFAESHSNLGFLLVDEGSMTEAARHFRLAIDYKPHFSLPHFGLGQLLQSQGKTTEAINHFLKTLAVEDEKTPLFMYTLADAYAKAGNRRQAIHYAQQAKQRAVSLGQTTLVADIEALLRQLDRAGEPK